MRGLLSMRTLARLVVSLLILGTGLAGFFMLGTRGSNRRPKAAEAAPAPIVDTQRVEAYQRPLTIQVDGLAVPFREIEVAAEVAGRIASKEAVCRAGRFVKHDMPLMQIDRSRYELEEKRLSTLV
ncbi:MAG: hemolysin D, partial [Planctomycetaceae bacterium]